MVVFLCVHSSQIFYSDWLRNSRQSAYIASAFMDGTNITKIRPYQLGWPNGLTIDYSNNRLYWACLLYTSPSPRDLFISRMPSSA